MGGRLEKETQERNRMNKKLEKLPKIFTSFYNWMDTREKTYTTMRNYINHTVDFMKFFTKGKNNEEFYKNVSDEDIERYMTSIRRKVVNGKEIEVGDDIRASRWSSLNTFFKFLMQKRYIEVNPMLQTERPKVKTEHTVTYMTSDEIESVFLRIQKEARPMVKNRDMAIIAMGIGTALRVSAITNINVEDINFKNNTIRVIEKGRKTREINFGDSLRNILLIWLEDRRLYFNGKETGPLFISQKKTRISVDSIEALVKKYTDHLPKTITPHKLRSSSAMNLIKEGADIITIKTVLGHNNIATTERYLAAYEEEVSKATNILDNLI